MSRMTSADDQRMAFGQTEEQAERARWINELGEVRWRRLDAIVQAIAELRAHISKRLELHHRKLKDLADLQKRVETHSEMLDHHHERLSDLEQGPVTHD